MIRSSSVGCRKMTVSMHVRPLPKQKPFHPSPSKLARLIRSTKSRYIPYCQISLKPVQMFGLSTLMQFCLQTDIWYTLFSLCMANSPCRALHPFSPHMMYIIRHGFMQAYICLLGVFFIYNYPTVWSQSKKTVNL
jgi:hypothetical protein